MYLHQQQHCQNRWKIGRCDMQQPAAMGTAELYMGCCTFAAASWSAGTKESDGMYLQQQQQCQSQTARM